MEIAVIGLGKMGLGISNRLSKKGIKVYGYDSGWNENLYKENNINGANNLNDLISLFESSRKIIWVMVPSGKATDDTIANLNSILNDGDIVIDGGNSNYKESIKKYNLLKSNNISFLDSGTSGGVWGEEEGYCLMVGGDKEVYEICKPIFEALSADGKGYGYMGKSGSGHFVKMIHNGIEYGMMQSMAEGIEILNQKKEYSLDLTQITELWKSGSVVRSWLLDLLNDALKENPNLDGIAPYVEDSGEGRWTIQEAIDLDVPAHAITSSLYSRFYSRNSDSFSFKVLSSLRNQFGGHNMKKSN
ncbi:MAG: decarboxylating 6-phosphogluconate dehydrogenase [Chloroflexota bacterium]|nr:decarboxylating 6-phosphogluconate dehydrogenase [Chloroflexota bacterium]MEC8440191.1 decarboxylating 6-phosphogluconate dehydrogenase [Chloroflexota bacterium]MEE2621086.1 decarboxylating 6-phosphogluconate dehydrogenase [Chloroflexota bacterium]